MLRFARDLGHLLGIFFSRYSLISSGDMPCTPRPHAEPCYNSYKDTNRNVCMPCRKQNALNVRKL